MTPYDLLFVAVFLAFVVSIALVVANSFRGRHAAALRLLKWTLSCAACYLAIVALVALTAPQQVVPIGQDRCFDNWCIAVAGVHTERAENGGLYNVTLRVSNRLRGVRKSAPDTHVYLIDEAGRRYEPLSRDMDAPRVGGTLDPLESASMLYRFHVPGNASHLGLVVSYGEAPGWFVIGDEQNPLHKKTIVPMPALAATPALQ